ETPMPFVHDHGFELKSRLPRRIAITAALSAVALAVGSLVAARVGGEDHPPLGKTLKVGYNQGSIPQSAIVKYIADKVDRDHGITVEPYPVNDANQVNGSTADGKLAANITQHAEWLKVIVANEGYAAKAVQPIFTQAFALYSQKYGSVRELPHGARITLPNDPANQTQALLTLQKVGLIKLKKEVDPLTAQLGDIAENPHGFRWHEVSLDAIARSLPDVDAAINYAYKFRVAKIPIKQRILLPPADERFAIQLVVGDAYADDPAITRLKAAFADPRVARFIKNNLDVETQPAKIPADQRQRAAP
ncbi:hypothetical protein JBE27_45600, partial [Streptomyces albiflaviniger]|nr:hypothetical protein [Streptomyces albiflaviniger]